MKTKPQDSSEAAQDYLKKAKEATFEEQDRYREIFDKSAKNDEWEGLPDVIAAKGWQGILEIMKDCTHPPTSEDRSEFLKTKWNEDLTHIKINKIADENVRFWAFHLHQAVEHTQRLRSMAKFIERIGPLKGFGGFLFTLWSKRSSLKALHGEAIQLGRKSEAKEIQMCIEDLDKFTECILTFEPGEEPTESR